MMRAFYGVVAAVLLASLQGAQAAAPDAVCQAHAQSLLQALTHQQFQQAVAPFAPEVAAQLPPAKLQAIWTRLQTQAGPFKQFQPLTASADGVLLARTDFASRSLNTVIHCDAQDRIDGLHFLPAATAAAAHSSTGVASRLDVPSPLGPLHGTLVLPRGSGPFPAVVLVAGSGPLDQDETVGPNKPFRDLADGLAAAGIASLRYDKRSQDYAARIGAGFTIDQEVTDDAQSALRLLAQQNHIDPHRVFVVGHSLGAVMAPRIAARDPQLAGVVLLAAATSFNLDYVIEQQRRQAAQFGAPPAAQLAQALAPLIKQRDALAKADPAHPPAGDFAGAPAAYWLSLRAYDPIATAQQLRVPMLFLQGASDTLVFAKYDFATWQKTFAHDPRVTLREYPGLTHLFTSASNPPAPDDIVKPGHVDPTVIQDIASWIKAQPKHS